MGCDASPAQYPEANVNGQEELCERLTGSILTHVLASSIDRSASRSMSSQSSSSRLAQRDFDFYARQAP